MGTDPRGYYSALGVSFEATSDEVKRAYKKLALRWHPDKNQGNQEATDMFQKISTAYAVLSDDEKRENYDNGHLDDEQEDGFDDFDMFMGMFMDMFGSINLGRTEKIHFKTSGTTQCDEDEEWESEDEDDDDSASLGDSELDDLDAAIGDFLMYGGVKKSDGKASQKNPFANTSAEHLFSGISGLEGMYDEFEKRYSKKDRDSDYDDDDDEEEEEDEEWEEDGDSDSDLDKMDMKDLETVLQQLQSMKMFVNNIR
eukprot:GDKJ01015336.1.p1 GENE.GDKJ01015336.1~~GDKJ01015336.1.p1  ORF type:complete len:255 (+),score=84.03 GDKJ01015336.1:25-789(+)